MKQIDELESMLVKEISKSIRDMNPNLNLDYYNEVMGDTSFLLASVLENYLKKRCDWNLDKWIDDSLLTRVRVNKNIVSIWGVMIWGKKGYSEQWVAPFYFEITLNNDCNDFIKFNFLYEEDTSNETTYEHFNKNRDMWDKCVYLTEHWNPFERSWKYMLDSNSPLGYDVILK
jgi:hypothetical protein